MDLLTQALGFIGLNGQNGNGKKLPNTRLGSAGDARRLLSTSIQEDVSGGRALQRAIVKGCVDGNPPYDDVRRRAEGRGWEANFNFMKGQAIMNRTAVPYYNLFARVDHFAECRTAYQPDNPDHEFWCQAIGRRFHNMLKRWREFQWNIQQVSYWMRLHGIGFAFFDRPYDWRFRSIETGCVLVPKGSPSSADQRLPFMFIRVPYRIVELWERIENEKAATATGWNVPAVKNAIRYGMRGLFQGQNNEWASQPFEAYQRMLKNHDLTASFTDGDFVNCAIMLVQESGAAKGVGGKISKFIFTEHPVFSEEIAKDKSTKAANDSLLFADPNCYETYLDAIVPFFRNTGDGTWHSVRGYAMEAFKHLEIENRLLCQVINREFLNSSLILQFPNERARTLGQLKVTGTVVALPPQSEFKQIVVQGGTEGAVLIHRIMDSHLSNNLGVFQPRSMSREDGKGEQPTARQVDYQAGNEASIGEGEITMFYEQLDSLYRTMFERAADSSYSDEEAKRFRDECKEDGVPPKALQDMEYVRANRQNGYGSPEMGIMKMQQLVQLVPMLPEDGKQAWLEDAVTQIAGPEKTKRYAPRQHVPNDQDWEAAVENQMIADGRLPIIATGQDDVIHLQRHFEDAQQTLAPVGQQMQQAQQNGQHGDPQVLQKAATYATVMAQHVEEHLNRLQKDPSRRAEGKTFEDQFKQLAEFSRELWQSLRRSHRAIQIESEQGQQATALSALDQAKVQSVQTGTALAAQKTQAQIQNQRARTAEAIRLKGLKTAADITEKGIRTSAIQVPSEVTQLSSPASELINNQPTPPNRGTTVPAR